MVWKGKILSKQNIFLVSKNRKYQCPYPCTLINVKQNVKTFCSVCTPIQPCNRCNSTNRADERYGYIRLMFQENIKFFRVKLNHRPGTVRIFGRIALMMTTDQEDGPRQCVTTGSRSVRLLSV